ncbi:hypothetical protein C8N36_102363 [Pelagimonas varians]|uniref:Uncharacterized protein n=1 Tax=Pelagimonas varians TaxID=696760 RepID=A0A238K3G2_9RHOB|nr:hypothetical protein C8N36_102363 [Pelagimonas varians]SMX36486.1 hypothetical protein PEV8663_00824 [Pelagimonas varians]
MKSQSPFFIFLALPRLRNLETLFDLIEHTRGTDT